MSILIKSVKVIDKGSPFDGQVLDILIKDGIIAEMGTSINVSAKEIIEINDLCISVGWCDLRTHGRNPGYEQKEDFESLTNAAVSGGFTDVALLPNTNPIIQSKEAVAYLKSVSSQSKVNYWPIAAATHNCEGKDINEMLDLNEAGAIAFSDGALAVDNPETILKIFQYISQFNGLFINRAEESKLNRFGQMHEGLQSNLLGLKGLPAMAEEMAIERDLNILTYLGSLKDKVRYHISTISTARSVELIRNAKKNGYNLTCDVAYHQLIFTETELATFDPNYKVTPPFRTKADQEALWAGLVDGTIDAIVSDHCPHDPEAKVVEFDLAEFGIIGLETLFGVLNKHNTTMRYPQIIEKISYNPRKILGLPSLAIKPNQPAHFTLFNTHAKWEFSESNIKSKSKNTPFVGMPLLGKVHGTITNNKMNHAQ